MGLTLTGLTRIDRPVLLAMEERLKGEIARLTKSLKEVQKRLKTLESQSDDFVHRKYSLSPAGAKRISLAAKLRGLKKDKKKHATEIAEIESELERLKPIVAEARRQQMSQRNRSRQ